MDFFQLDALLNLADSVQDAVEAGRWAYLAVISVFIMIQLAKKSDHIKKNASRYSAGLGAVTGAVLSDDPVQGAMGGLMVGNAASGLFSLLKSFSGNSVVSLLVLLANEIRAATTKNSKKIEADFDKAFDSAKSEGNTEELEKWNKENL